MKATIGLSWKSLVSKIHPPLPMSPRDSQRLLSLLNTSFEQQLDRYHPPGKEHDASLQLRTILSNPLFEAKSSNGTKLPTSGRRKSGKALDVLQNLVRRPAEIFKEQINAGSASLDTAKLCIRAEQRNCLASPQVQLRDALSSSGMGSLVLEWIWASGHESSKAFLADREFVRYFVPFLVAEEKQDRILRWLQEIDSDSQGAHLLGVGPPTTQDWSNLLLQLISAENRYGRGLESAIEMFARSVDESQSTSSKHHQLHVATGWYLTIGLAVTKKSVQMEWSIVQRLIKAVKTFSRPKSLIAAYHSVHLAKDARPDVALNYLQSLAPGHTFPASKSPHVISLSLKAAEIFLDKNREYEAKWLLEYLQDNFRNEIGAHVPLEHRLALPKISLVQETRELQEEMALRSLDILAIH